MAEIGDYRVDALKSTPPSTSGSGVVNVLVRIERMTEKDPDSWKLIDNGHRTISIPYAVMMAFANGAEAIDWVVEQAKAAGVAQSDEANEKLLELTGGTWNGFTKEFSF